MTKAAIYQIKNLINNKVYIGSSITVNLRINNHRHKLNKNIHDNFHLQSSWNKYSSEAFEFTILQKVENEKDLLKYEQFWIDLTKCYDYKFGYNLNRIAGSNVGYKHTEEHKAYMSNLHKGRKVSEETKTRLKNNHYLRDKEKWPHENGCRCKCDECRPKANAIRASWKRKQRWWLVDVKTS